MRCRFGGSDDTNTRCAPIVVTTMQDGSQMDYPVSTDDQHPRRRSLGSGTDGSPRLEHYSQPETPPQQHGQQHFGGQQFGQQGSRDAAGGTSWSTSTALPGHLRKGSLDTVDMPGGGGYSANAFGAGVVLYTSVIDAHQHR